MTRPRRRNRVLAALVSALTVTTAALVAPPAQPAAAAPADHCQSQCLDILPPGQNGNATLVDILFHQLFGTRPRHSADQLDRYARLVYNYAGLTDAQLTQYFHSAAFGVPAGQVERSYRPRSDVTIVRDRATGVPHITGTTRAGTMFGAGYAGAEDRLFTMDLLRHLGRGRLTPFAGGAPGNQALEQSVWRHSPYPEADLQAQVEAWQQLGERGATLLADAQAYVAGVNAYIETCMDRRNCPGEYVLAGHLDAITNEGGPEPFQLTDLVAIAGVIGGLFGTGGGAEVQSALVRVAARARYGPVEGDRVWAGFRSANDPETVLTLHDGQSFPYGDPPPDAPSVALPDAGSVSPEPVTDEGDVPAALPRGMSNAVVISGQHTTTGHPIAVYGPQTGYFVPQLLMVQELQGPGISARGIAFAGLNLYVQIGRGPDYSWSATSPVHDVTDVFAVPLCTPDGSPPTLQSNHYLWHGQCLPMEELAHVNSWTPTVADPSPPGSYRLVTWRTRYGLVAWRGTVDGQPHAFTKLRSSYRHEVDSAIGFQMFNDPAVMGSAAGFADAAANVRFTFNWFYVNSADSAYFLSGLHPRRAAGSDPNLPMHAEPAFEWVDYDHATNTAAYEPASSHPQSVNQDYYVNWNNKQAMDFSAADGNFSFGAVHRGELLDAPVRAALAAGQRFDRAGVVRLVEQAGLTDLRGREVLDDLLRVLDSQPITDPSLATVVDQLRAWHQAGALRLETSAGSRQYGHAAAIRVFDAWWPLLVRGQFRAELGPELYQSLVDTMQINESPSGGQRGDVSTPPGSAAESQPHKGSAFQYGWWGFVEKDLRAVLGDPVDGGPGRTFCGSGALADCRQVLLDTLRSAAAQPASQVYPADESCAAGDQWCADSIQHAPLGGITVPGIAWQNRPTYQQVVSFPVSS
jgi:acyl-homoserine lactone acylase PvdQ